MALQETVNCSEHFEQYTKKLYPLNKIHLPQKWNYKDKVNNLKLSCNNLRVTYNGSGRSHKEAGSVRADHPIPASCGIYYFEVTIISKGRDGYFGIGLALEKVNLNRLPGWDRGSYGYHADDGHAFSASASGQAYGPTFGTGDVVGCGVDFLENSCFFTKNGVCLGTAFTDIPPSVYPVVGLQTPGEELEANFGQRPFLYNIEALMQEARSKLLRTVQSKTLVNTDSQSGAWQASLQKLVNCYLVHRGFSASAEAFARATNLPLGEALEGVRHRQRILGFIANGHIGEAIELTEKIYPDLLSARPHLLFQLKCRQFIEMVIGADYKFAPKCGSTESSPPTSEVFSCKLSGVTKNGVTNGHNGVHLESGVENMMDCTEAPVSSTSNCSKEASHVLMERILDFGRELHALSVQLRRHRRYEDSQRTQLRDAFSLLAYSHPSTSPVAHLLHSSQRQAVASALNSAILDSQGLASTPPLETCLAHTHRCLNILSSTSNCGASAFLDLDTLASSCAATLAASKSLASANTTTLQQLPSLVNNVTVSNTSEKTINTTAL